MIKFGYDQYFKPFQIESFLSDLFNDERVQSLITKNRLGNVSKVLYSELEHNVTSLSFFDVLKPDIVRSNGSIVKCLDEYYDSFVVSDQLRKCLLMEEEDVFKLFSESDRHEFIFHVFKSLCLGGTCCQFEDDLQPYLDMTRKIYKDMITVVKDSKTEKIKVASHVYQIVELESSIASLFPISHPQNFCYVSIDPAKRHVNILYHASDSYY